MAIVNSTRENDSWLKPFKERENAIAALRGAVDRDNTITRGGMYCLEIINQLIQNGTRIFERIPQSVFSGLPEGGRRNVQAAALLRANDGAVPEQQGEILESGYTREQEIIGRWAERDGCWSDTPDGDMTRKGYTHDSAIDGSESQVYFDQRRQWVHKTIDHVRYRDLSRFLDRINIHNALFPETAMTIVGWGLREYADDNTGFCAIIRQPFVQGRAPTQDEINRSMKDRGLRPADGAGFFFTSGDGDILVTDLHDGNAVVDRDGHVIVYDCEAMLNDIESLQGKWSVPPLDYDEENVKAVCQAVAGLLPTEYPEEKVDIEGWFAFPGTVRFELEQYGRTFTPALHHNGKHYILQKDTWNPGTLLVSEPWQLERMLHSHGGLTDEGVRLTPEQLRTLAEGDYVAAGNELLYFNLDKGRIDTIQRGIRLRLKQKQERTLDNKPAKMKIKLSL